jgi:tetratricopeptide (TPR) repeat protein
MRANVLTDAALAKHAGRFVWLSIDTEKAQNGGFLEQFPIENWPSFLVVNSATQSAVLKWLGTATVPQLERLFEDGERAVLAKGSTGSEAALAQADRAYAEGRRTEAARLYQQALGQAPGGWSRRPRAVESLVYSFQEAKDFENCARAALGEVPKLPPSSSSANAAGTGLTCALAAPKDAGWRSEAISKLEPWLKTSLSIPDLLPDDRSGIYELLLRTREEEKDRAGAKQLASDWLRFLELEAAKASSPEARAAFDSHRLVAAMKLGDPARAVVALQASEKDLPQDYNPPARLAIAYSALGRYEQALAAANRALDRAYGPRRIRVFESKAEIYRKMGDRDATRRTLEEAIRFAESLPKGQRSERAIARLKADALRTVEASR